MDKPEILVYAREMKRIEKNLGRMRAEIAVTSVLSEKELAELTIWGRVARNALFNMGNIIEQNTLK